MTERTPEQIVLAACEEIILDYFAFQAAACTTQPDCQCGRGPEHHPQREEEVPCTETGSRGT